MDMGIHNSDIPGPGKFESNASLMVSEYLHDLMMDGFYDEQFGSVSEPPFFWEALITLDLPNEVENPAFEKLQWAYIIITTEQGFFEYYGFDRADEARNEYMSHLAAYESQLDEVY